MYKVALEEMGKIVHGLYVIHIPKGRKGKLHNIEIIEREKIVELMERWHDIHK